MKLPESMEELFQNMVILAEVTRCFDEIRSFQGPDGIAKWIATNPVIMSQLVANDNTSALSEFTTKLVTLINRHDWDIHEERRGGFKLDFRPYEIFFNHDTHTSTELLHKKIPLEMMMNEVFHDRDKKWLQESESFAQETLSDLASYLPQGAAFDTPFAQVHGSFARRMYGVHQDFENVTRTLYLTSTHLPDSTPAHISAAFDFFKEGPHDLDVKTVTDISPQIPHLMVTMVNRWTAVEGYTITSFDNNNILLTHPVNGRKININTLDIGSKKVLKAEIVLPDSSKPPFCIDIAALTDTNLMRSDFRSGPHHTLKRLPKTFLHQEESGDISLSIDLDDIITHSAVLMAPSEIVDPTYQSYNQALYAGLSLIRHELMWPSIWPERIKQETVEAYKQELSRQRKEAQDGRQNAPSAFRREELMREGILILTFDAPEAIDMMKLLGISEAQGIQDGLNMWCSMPKNEFRQLIGNNPKFTQYVAEMFDIEKI